MGERTAKYILIVWMTALPALAAADERPGEAAAWAADAVNQYRVLTDLVYGRAEGNDLKLDLFLPEPAAGPGAEPGRVRTVVYFHGGGWVGGSRYTDVLMLLPWLERRWAVVNVGYRKAQTSLAPAAVEDARCALRWVVGKAEEYGFDPDRVVLTGPSAGGHLAMMAGFLTQSDGFDYRCPGGEPPEAAAVVNWFGITDVEDLLDGENRQAFAVAWLGNAPDRKAAARRVSPLSYVRPGLPPVITIHGDQDRPHEQAVRLHHALTSVGVENALVTVPGGGHASFDRAQQLEAYRRIWAFLDAALGPDSSSDDR
jgi:acetyl esterase/lipase